MEFWGEAEPVSVEAQLQRCTWQQQRYPVRYGRLLGFLRVHTYMQTHTLSLSHTHTHNDMYTQVCMYVCMHACMHACVYTCQ